MLQLRMASANSCWQQLVVRLMLPVASYLKVLIFILKFWWPNLEIVADVASIVGVLRVADVASLRYFIPFCTDKICFLVFSTRQSVFRLSVLKRCLTQSWPFLLEWQQSHNSHTHTITTPTQGCVRAQNLTMWCKRKPFDPTKYFSMISCL